ncbi:hypothetical protein [Pseudooceanicola nanhaiensis]|uniref:hypothetical protein n=1 Tax=Pseudooceanicola nanhaiensis TaxID=375761 RepID=UPI001CD2D7E2|nr:hypothetical protein [Pseudooceanicola nanhaiensis]MCA0919155.1 hypothetical protein [Pseudooceanicola nanhaiensis]
MLFVILIPIVFVLLAIYAKRETRDCRWRADRTRDTDEGALYHCIYCGAETRTADGKPPQVCNQPEA